MRNWILLVLVVALWTAPTVAALGESSPQAQHEWDQWDHCIIDGPSPQTIVDDPEPIGHPIDDETRHTSGREQAIALVVQAVRAKGWSGLVAVHVSYEEGEWQAIGGPIDGLVSACDPNNTAECTRRVKAACQQTAKTVKPGSVKVIKYTDGSGECTATCEGAGATTEVVIVCDQVKLDLQAEPMSCIYVQSIVDDPDPAGSVGPIMVCTPQRELHWTAPEDDPMIQGLRGQQ